MITAAKRPYFFAAFIFLTACSPVHAEEKSLKEYFDQANAFRDQGDLVKAEENYTQAIEMNSSYPILHYRRGEVRFKKNDLDGAILDLTKGLSLSPRSKRAYYALCLRSEAFFLKKDLERSASDLEKAIALDPKEEEAYRRRGGAYAAQGKIEKAFSDLDHAIELDPTDDENYSARAKIYFSKSKYKEAAADYSRAIELNSGSDVAYAGRGTTRFVQSDYRGALSDLREAVALNPSQQADLEKFIEQAEKILR